MAKMKSGIRSKTAHRTKEQAVKHGRTYGAKPEQITRRSSRNKARAKLVKTGAVRKGDGKDVAHKNDNPMSNGRKNLAVQSRKKNRGHGRSPGGTKKTRR